MNTAVTEARIGMMARMAGGGTYADRLLYARQNKGFPVSYEWADLDIVTYAGMIDD